MKEFKIDEVSVNSFKKEMEILLKLKHPTIISLFGYGEDNNSMFLLMELMDLSLKKVMDERKKRKNVSWWKEEEIIQFFRQILSGMEYLHSKKIAHRDIKVLFLKFQLN